jgi:DNA-binding NarL/FixJ family response regulator
LLRILVVDDHEAVRKGICAILSHRPDVEQCHEAGNGLEAIEKARELKPHLIVLDVTMPVMSGLTAARTLVRELPESLILLLTMHQSRQLVEEAKSMGIRGYVSKGDAGAKLLDAVDALLRGETFFPESIGVG